MHQNGEAILLIRSTNALSFSPQNNEANVVKGRPLEVEILTRDRGTKDEVK